MSLGHGTSIVRSGLILHLDAANPKSYTGSGTAWIDLCSSGKNGTLINTPIYSTPNKGIFTFDGSTNYVDTLGYSYTTAFTDRTMSAWFNCFGSNPASANQGVLVLSDGTSNAQLDIVLAVSTTITATVRINTDISNATADATNLNLNTWYNVAAVENHNNNSISIYLNGVLIQISTFTGTTYQAAADRVRVGCQKTANSRYFNGNISNISVYNRALTPLEVRQNFEALRGRYSI